MCFRLRSSFSVTHFLLMLCSHDCDYGEWHWKAGPVGGLGCKVLVESACDRLVRPSLFARVVLCIAFLSSPSLVSTPIYRFFRKKIVDEVI